MKLSPIPAAPAPLTWGRGAMTALTGALLLFLGAGGSLYCLMSAFSLPGTRQVLEGAALAALALGVLCALPWRWPLFAAVAAGLLLQWQERETLVLGFRRVAYELTSIFSLYYADVSPAFSEAAEEAAAQGAAISFLLFTALSLAAVLALGVLALRLPLLGVLFTLPVVCLTLFIIPYPPDGAGLVMVLAFWLGAFLTQPLRKGGRAPGFAAGALAALLALLLALEGTFPQETYLRAAWSDGLRTTLTGWSDQIAAALGLPGLEVVQGGGSPFTWHYDSESLDLSQAGPNRPRRQTVLQVRSSVSGPVYLRGFALEIYADNTWTAADGRTQADRFLSQFSELLLTGARLSSTGHSEGVGLLDLIYVNDTSGLDYYPYFALDNTPSLLEDPDGPEAAIHRRSFTISSPTAEEILQAAQEPWPYGYTLSATLYSPGAETAPVLRELAQEGGVDIFETDAALLAEQVAAYIRSAATYTLNAPAAPEGEDFALYFLTESQRGYCVHFATAAALTLQALGVPARYTAGFVVNIREDSVDQWVNVTDLEAHAWVEYFVEGVGWLPLEVTPGFEAAGSGAGEEDPQESPSLPPSETPQPSEEPQPSETPEESDDPQETPQGGPGGAGFSIPWAALLPWLGGLGALALAALLPLLRRKLLLARRRRAVEEGDPNRGTIAAWLWLEKLVPYGAQAPEELADLAGKARFSQHALTPEERQRMAEHLWAELARLGPALPRLRRLWLKYGRCLL